MAQVLFIGPGEEERVASHALLCSALVVREPRDLLRKRLFLAALG